MLGNLKGISKKYFDHLFLGQKPQPACLAEMSMLRKSLLEDFQITPEVVHNCQAEITKFCGQIDEQGGTIGCLMENANKHQRQRQGFRKGRKGVDEIPEFSSQCSAAVSRIKPNVIMVLSCIAFKMPLFCYRFCPLLDASLH